MSTDRPCPDSQSLHKLAQGLLTPEEVEPLAHHLEQCDRCAETVLGLKHEDTLVQAVRARRGVAEGADRPIVAALIERLRGLPADVATSSQHGTITTTGDSVATPSDASPEPIRQATTLPTPETARELYDFLAPPERPDELGRLGPYRVLEVLGAGGMGVVFLAEDIQLERKVALKAMKPALAASNSAKKRFVREARATAAIEHEHIVTIHQVGEDRGVPFLAMQLLQGESLDDRLRRVESSRHTPCAVAADTADTSADGTRSVPTTLPLADALRIGREIADGLAAAHAVGLMHRDIKPANVWLERSRHAPRDEGGTAERRNTSEQTASANAAQSAGRFPHAEREGYGRVKIVDFGLARAADDQAHLTQAGAITGTPAYMAPEQARGDAVDFRCDLFSLGCVMYRMLAGELPFQGKNTTAMLLALAQQTPKPIRERNPDVPEGVERLVMRLLEKDPAKRLSPATKVVEIIAAIEQKLAESRAKPASDPSPQRQQGFETVDPSLARRASVVQSSSVARPESANGVAASAESPPRPSRTQGVPHVRTPKGRWLPLAAAAAALFAVLTGGVVYRIATDKGELIIKSDELGVEVTIKRDGKPVENLEVSHGQTKTTVRSGEIEVVIRGANADTFVATSDQTGQPKFSLTRDGKVVVEIERKGGTSVSAAKGEVESNKSTTAQAIINKAAPLVTDFQEIHGADGDQLKAWMDGLQPQGFRPVLLNVESSTAPRFSAIATRDDRAVSWRFVSGVKEVDGLRHHVEMSKGGFRKYQFCVYREAGQLYTAIIWVSDGVTSWGAWGGPLGAVKSRVEQGRAIRLRPIELRSTELRRTLPFHCILAPDEGVDWEAHYDLTADGLRKLVAEQQAKQWLVDWLSAYRDGDQVRFLAVTAENRGKVNWKFLMDMTPQAYEKELTQQKSLGLRPLAMTSYAEGGETRYAAVWLQDLAQAADPDRHAAEWVLTVGGNVTIRMAGQDQEIQAVTNLPAESFQVVRVALVLKRQVQDAELEQLKGLTHLTWLDLGGTNVTGAGLQHLKGLKNLTWLSLWNTRITDSGLANLKELTKLNHLSLRSTRVTDAGLEQLKGLTSLGELILNGTKVTASGVASLQKALPNCKITWDGDESESGKN